MDYKTHFQSLISVIHYRWLLLCTLLGLMSGSAAALFLLVLDWVGQTQQQHFWLIALLPFAGWLIGWGYFRYGKAANTGSELLFEAYSRPASIIPLRTAPLVFLGTLLTHLGGGSAGREGTAVQMSTALADQLNRWFKLSKSDRQLLLLCGISGGFAAVFGTPWAGAIFALEVLALKKMRYDAILPVLATAWLAHGVCLLWSVQHSNYSAGSLPDWQFSTPFWVISLGLASGLCALLFVRTTHFFRKTFALIPYPPYRPLLGGLMLALLFLIPGSLRYAGLGLSIIAAAFTEKLLPWDFLLKLLFTAFTLGAAFKGGEVTPLFFMGAALGNVLSLFIPLPMALLAALGFVAVFAGATNTPIACWIMGMELFGWEYGLLLGLACWAAFLASGHRSIYGNQPLSPVRRYIRHRYLLKSRAKQKGAYL